MNRIRASNYTTIASPPSAALTSITQYKPSVILVMGATTLTYTGDRPAITKQLRVFAKAGGAVIFGGVPSALHPPHTAMAKLFFTAFHVRDWIISDTFETENDDATGRMQSPRLLLNATYLENVAVNARVYRTSMTPFEADEPCAVAIQAIEEGCLGYLGSVDLLSVESRSILMMMIELSLAGSGRADGRSPAEFVN